MLAAAIIRRKTASHGGVPVGDRKAEASEDRNANKLSVDRMNKFGTMGILSLEYPIPAGRGGTARLAECEF